ncbi:MAG: tRNA pseudouridine(38-40) synthase TruA [Bdellovibrionales bacterium]
MIKLLLSYDGSPYEGWQRQPGKTTVQGEIEAALSQIYNEPITIVGSGRTDAGTHAVGQVAHFTPPKKGPEVRLQRALNSMLPDTIAVKGVWETPPDFHSRKSARAKTYCYKIWNHPVKSALWHHRALHVPKPLDRATLARLAEEIVGERDFKSFQSTGTDVKTTVRRIFSCQWRERSPHLLEFEITGNGFLKQMVRNLVGTMLHLTRNQMEVADLRAIFAAHDRQAAKATVAAHGLYLVRVQYPSDLDNRCRKL